MSQHSYGFPVNNFVGVFFLALNLLLWLWQPIYADPLYVTLATPIAPSTALPSTASLLTPPTLIDQTQQVKSMGYTDSRKLVRDRAGNLYVAYRKKFKLHYETAYHVFVATSRDNGRTWAVLNNNRPIAEVGDFNQRVPSIAIDRHDRLHVVWYGADATSAHSDENQIKYVSSVDGGATWSAWRNIALVAGYAGEERWQEHPTVFVSEDQTIYIVWEGRDEWYNRAAQIKVIQSHDGGQTWTTWVNIAPTKYSRSRPSLVASGDTLYAFAYGSRSGIQQILYTTSTPGGQQWSPWQPVAASTQDQRHVSAAIDQRGTVHIVWRQPPFQAAQEEGRNSQIYYASFDGATWSAPTRVGSRGGGAQTYPSIAVDTDNMVWITWLETSAPYDFPRDAPTTGAVYYVAKHDQGWSQPILFGAGGNNLYPSLRRDLTTAGKDVDVVWVDAQPEGSLIRFGQLARPTQFAPAVAVDERSVGISSFTRIAWALEFDNGSLQALQVNLLYQRTAFWDEAAAVLQLIALVSLYVMLKFAITHWLRTTFE
jgi:hypothetical protein